MYLVGSEIIPIIIYWIRGRIYTQFDQTQNCWGDSSILLFYLQYRDKLSYVQVSVKINTIRPLALNHVCFFTSMLVHRNPTANMSKVVHTADRYENTKGSRPSKYIGL